jgi:hypothetical protein
LLKLAQALTLLLGSIVLVLQLTALQSDEFVDMVYRHFINASG